MCALGTQVYVSGPGLYPGPGCVPWAQACILGPGTYPGARVLDPGPKCLPWTRVYTYPGPGRFLWNRLLTREPGKNPLPENTPLDSDIHPKPGCIPWSLAHTLDPGIYPGSSVRARIQDTYPGPKNTPGPRKHIRVQSKHPGPKLSQGARSKVHTRPRVLPRVQDIYIYPCVCVCMLHTVCCVLCTRFSTVPS